MLILRFSPPMLSLTYCLSGSSLTSSYICWSCHDLPIHYECVSTVGWYPFLGYNVASHCKEDGSLYSAHIGYSSLRGQAYRVNIHLTYGLSYSAKLYHFGSLGHLNRTSVFISIALILGDASCFRTWQFHVDCWRCHTKIFLKDQFPI
jgi:hypothetical protein